MGKAVPEGDPDRGRKIFKQQCALCHSIAAGGEHMTGPNLRGIIGQKSGTVPGYEYTDESQNKGVTWTKETLFNYLENPSKYIPGTKMHFEGIESEKDRSDIAAYIASMKK